MSAPVQASLFAAPPQAEKPLFGRPAAWLCFGPGLFDAYKAEQERRAPSGFNADVRALAHVSFCYLLTVGEDGVRLQCPALSFDRAGAFGAVWPRFNALARAEAERLSGHRYAGEGDGCVTTAWQGETRARICNVKAA